MAVEVKRNNRWLHRYATFVAFATFLLIIAGALVTSNDAGLSVPDWPTSFGSFRMPRMVGGVKFEHGHRMIAGTVTILTIILALWLWRKDPRRWVRRLGGIAVLAIIAQAILGGITVLYFLPPPISMAHASLAQAFFCIMVSLAVFTRKDWEWNDAKLEERLRPSLRQLAVAATSLIFVQLVLGAAFRHHAFGIIPHVIVAVFVTVSVFWTVARVLGKFGQNASLRRAAMLLGSLVVVQLVLGVGSYFELLANKNAPQPLPPVVDVTTAHVAVGALVLASSLVLTLYAFRWAAPGENAALASEPNKVAA